MRALFTQVLLEKQEPIKAQPNHLPPPRQISAVIPAKTMTAAVSSQKQGILFE